MRVSRLLWARRRVSTEHAPLAVAGRRKWLVDEYDWVLYLRARADACQRRATAARRVQSRTKERRRVRSWQLLVSRDPDRLLFDTLQSGLRGGHFVELMV